MEATQADKLLIWCPLLSDPAAPGARAGLAGTWPLCHQEPRGARAEEVRVVDDVVQHRQLRDLEQRVVGEGQRVGRRLDEGYKDAVRAAARVEAQVAAGEEVPVVQPEGEEVDPVQLVLGEVCALAEVGRGRGRRAAGDVCAQPQGASGGQVWTRCHPRGGSGAQAHAACAVQDMGQPMFWGRARHRAGAWGCACMQACQGRAQAVPQAGRPSTGAVLSRPGPHTGPGLQACAAGAVLRPQRACTLGVWAGPGAAAGHSHRAGAHRSPGRQSPGAA